jgi:hypothetical protein
MTADGGELTEFVLPKPGSGPRILSRGSDGNLWFSEHDGNRIGRITPAGAITEFDIPTPDSHPRAIALGADGNIWFGEFTGNKIGRITPAGAITEFPVPTPDSGPRALAAGPDGNIWFSEYRRNQIGRNTPAGVITEYPLPRPNAGPGDITVGADGGLTAQRRLTNVNAPFGGAKHPQQPFVAFAALADDAAPGVISIRATGTAIPKIVTRITASADVDPCWTATTPNGKRLWTSNFQPASLSLYSVKSNGRLAAVSTYTPTSDSPGALDIAVDPRGKFLYQLRALDPAGGANPTPQIDVLRIGGSSANGGLQLVQSIQLSAGASSGSPTGIAVSDP